MARILRVNLSNLTAKTEDIPEIYQDLGGRGLTSRIIDNEVPPDCDPLGPANKLVFANGILGGTIVPCSGRLSVGAKSPLTRGIKESNTGGSMGQKLARLGIRALVIEGQAKDMTALRLDRDGVRFISAAAWAQLGGYALTEKLTHEFGDGTSVACIGIAGEMGLTAAGIIFTTPDAHLRLAARGGLGAVMGSKNLKAIMVEDNGSNQVEVKDPKRLKEEVGILSRAVLANPFVGALREIGTPAMLAMTNASGILPTKNFSAGQFEQADLLGADHMLEILKERPNGEPTHRCMDGCTISCSNIYPDDRGETIVAGVEYETLALVGSNCLIDDLDEVTRINRVCNDVGVDAMEIGGALAVAMEAGLLPWGDGAAALALVNEIAQGSENGRMIGNGAKFTGEKLGVRRTPHVKGQCISGYDPRVLKGTGVTYATSPMGADHTAGIVLPGPQDPSYDPSNPNAQAEKSQFMQNWMAAVDTLGICMMVGMPVMEGGPGLQRTLIGCVGAVLGKHLGDNFLIDLGSSVLKSEKHFNAGAGFTAKDDRLPAFFSEESLAPGGPVFDVPPEEIAKVNRF